jgi:transcriptional regulator with XRE-family HTH domain
LNTFAPHIRFREARERLGLSPDEVAKQSGVSSAEIWDIEAYENELTSCHSPRSLQLFCRVLRVQPVDLFGGVSSGPAISPAELVQRIHEECRSRQITLEQFEDVVGWRLSESIEPAEKLLEDLTVDGLQWLCRELRIDWLRAI